MNKPYAILSFRDANGEMYKLDMGGRYTCNADEIYDLQDMLDYIESGFIEIYSVKRKRDGAVIKLSDYFDSQGSIIKFDIEPVTHEVCAFISRFGSIVAVLLPE